MRRRPLPSSEAAAGLLVAGVLALAGCAGPAGPTIRSAEPVAVTSPPAMVAIETDVSYATNLFHWVDNLAGTSLGKTRETYRRHWLQWAGSLDDGDRKALAGFRRARRWSPGDPPRFSEDATCVPDTDGALSARQRLSVAAMEARSLDDLVERAAEVLPAAELAGLRAALERFDGRFRAHLWARSEYLQGFRTDMEQFLATATVRRLVNQLVRFIGAHPDDVEPARISLVAVLERGPTHAEADGRHLLLEIRPGDRGRDQTQVIFHELAHHLMRSLPAAERSALARELLREGPDGALAWSLLQESLPTALGQGVAQSRMAPAFREDTRWYHIDAVDRFAHALYADARRALRTGQSLRELVPDGVIRALRRSGVSGAPANHMGRSVLAAPGRRYAPLRALAGLIEQGSPFEANLDHAESEAFLERYACLPLVVVATEGEWESLRLPDADRRALPPDVLPLRPDLAGVIVPVRRASGAAALFIIGREGGDLHALVRAVRAMKRWPSAPVEVLG